MVDGGSKDVQSNSGIRDLLSTTMSLPEAKPTPASAAPAGKEMSAKEIEDAIMMPPPPNPLPKVILEPEMNGLQEALQVRPCPETSLHS
jgi:hypothetical protein